MYMWKNDVILRLAIKSWFYVHKHPQTHDYIYSLFALLFLIWVKKGKYAAYNCHKLICISVGFAINFYWCLDSIVCMWNQHCSWGNDVRGFHGFPLCPYECLTKWWIHCPNSIVMLQTSYPWNSGHPREPQKFWQSTNIVPNE